MYRGRYYGECQSITFNKGKFYACPNKPQKRCFNCSRELCTECISQCTNCDCYVCHHDRCKGEHLVYGSCFLCNKILETRTPKYQCDNCSNTVCWRCKVLCKDGNYCRNCSCPHIISCICAETHKCSLYDMKHCDICHELSFHISFKETVCCSEGGNKNKKIYLILLQRHL